MSKTFGARKKDSLEVFYDEYPLEDLVHLLAFEDADEAKQACHHFNITVEKRPLTEGTNELVEMVLWRTGRGFKERKDPEKGTTIPLKPRKMIRTIESKLRGATRLAICRGEVSGITASLNASESPEAMMLLKERIKKREENRRKRQEAIEQAQRHEALQREALQKKKEARLREQAMELARKQEAQRKDQEVRQRREEENMRLKLEAEEKERREQEANAERQRLEEIKFKKQNEMERQRLEQEAERERIRLEVIERKRQKQLEEQRRKEEAEKERLRIERVERKRQERLERERREKEAEAERLRLERIEKERQEELERLRRREEAERQRIELEWQRKIAYARKVVVMKMWVAKLSSVRDKREKTKSSIESFDPLSTGDITSMWDSIRAQREEAELRRIRRIEELELQKLEREQMQNTAILYRWEEEPSSTRASLESFDPLSTMAYSAVPVQGRADQEADEKENEPILEIEQEKTIEIECVKNVEEPKDDHITESQRPEGMVADELQMILAERDAMNDDFSSKLPPFSNKRQIVAVYPDPSGRKRSKRPISKEKKRESADLRKSKNFTNNLKALNDTAGIGGLLNDPILAKLIESDEQLQRLADFPTFTK